MICIFNEKSHHENQRMALLKYNDHFFYNVSGCKVHKYSTPDQEYLSQKHKRTKDELVKI